MELAHEPIFIASVLPSPEDLDAWNPSERHCCHDCGCYEGELHERGCDMERCPFCLGQLISCSCSNKHFYPEYNYLAHPYCNLPKRVYEKGLPKKQADEWEKVLERKGRIPYVRTPNLCARCGKCWPDMFHEDEWDRVIPADIAEEMLCYPCYLTIRNFVLRAREDGKCQKKNA